MRKLVLGITLGTLVLLAGGLLHTGGVVRAQTAATPVPGSQRGTATKSCDASRVPVGSSVTCTITLGFATGDIAIFPDPVVIGVTGAVVTGASCSASATMPFPSNCMTTVTPTSVATNCTVGVSPACAAGTVAGFAFMTSITETLRCDVAGPVTETIVSGPDLLTPATLAPATPLTCTAQPAAVVLKTANPNPATFGQPLTYTVTVQNSGAVPTTALQLSDPLPAGVTFQSVTTTAGSCSQAGGTVSCSLGTLPAGGSATVTIRVTPLVTGTLTNTATVRDGNTAADDHRCARSHQPDLPGGCATAAADYTAAAGTAADYAGAAAQLLNQHLSAGQQRPAGQPAAVGGLQPGDDKQSGRHGGERDCGTGEPASGGVDLPFQQQPAAVSGGLLRHDRSTDRLQHHGWRLRELPDLRQRPGYD